MVNDIPAGDGKTANIFLQCISYLVAATAAMKTPANEAEEEAGVAVAVASADMPEGAATASTKPSIFTPKLLVHSLLFYGILKSQKLPIVILAKP